MVFVHPLLFLFLFLFLCAPEAWACGSTFSSCSNMEAGHLFNMCIPHGDPGDVPAPVTVTVTTMMRCATAIWALPLQKPPVGPDCAQVPQHYFLVAAVKSFSMSMC